MPTKDSLLHLIVLASCLVLPCKGHVITLEEHNSRKGENFCSTRAQGIVFKNLCVRAALSNKIENYDSVFATSSCSSTELKLFSEKTGKDETTTEDLLHCKYFRKGDTAMVDRKKYPTLDEIDSTALARGQGKNDVMEYKTNDQGVTTPHANHLNWLEWEEAAWVKNYW